MAEVWLVHGYLGVGKTTLAKVLAEETGAVRFSSDEWMTALFGDDPPESEFGGMYDRVQGVLDSVWPEFVRRGVPVVLDFGFWGVEFRAGILDLVGEAGGRVRWVKVVCDEGEVRERLGRRNLDLNGSLVVTENTFEVLRGRFFELGDGECDFVVDSSGMGVEDLRALVHGWRA